MSSQRTTARRLATPGRPWITPGPARAGCAFDAPTSHTAPAIAHDAKAAPKRRRGFPDEPRCTDMSMTRVQDCLHARRRLLGRGSEAAYPAVESMLSVVLLLLAFHSVAAPGAPAPPQPKPRPTEAAAPDVGKKAMELYEAKKYDEAIRVLEAALVKTPKDPDLLFDLGLVQREKG